MLFDLFNDLASFQGNINKTFAKKLNSFVVMYLDNILIYIKELSQLHMKVV